MLRRFVCDSDGQDLIEYGLLGGLIAVAALLVLPGILSKMSAAYSNGMSGIQQIWEPCPPAPAACP